MTIVRRTLPLCLAICANLALFSTAHSAPVKKTPPKGGTEPASVPHEFVIDSVIASVDDKPITLSDLGSRLTPPRRLTLAEVGKDQAALMALDALIMEKLIEAEAASKRVVVSDSELEDYIQEVARRNGLSRAEFEAALANQGQSLKTYRQQIKVDILKTKLAGSISRGGTSVSESEIDEYLASSNELTQGTASIRLRHILISAQGKDPAQVQERVKQVTTALENGEEFGQVASQLSDGPHASDGGLIGTVAVKDLSSDIQDAVATVNPGSYTAPLESENGVQFFFVEERFAESSEESENRDESTEARRAEARRILQQQKTQSRLSSYFIGELYKNHAVDKKI
jgi:peptidyl-prolyl cis-trans isomerase SurA